MKRNAVTLISLLIGLAIGGAVMWVYTERNMEEAKPAAVSAPEKKILFYRHPMNPSVTSPTPQKDEMGMDFIPVYEEETKPEGERKVLFYRHPMNPSVTSPTPQKDEMGMDYIPVYEDEGKEELPPGAVRITPERIQKIGVKSEEVKKRTLKRTIRTVGRVEPVENKVYLINAKFSGWVEKLYISRTDQMVSPGEPILEIYSPELVSAQEEYLLALRSYNDMKNSPYPEVSSGAESLLNAARQRLKYWDVTDEQIKRLEETGKVSRTIVLRAPAHGGVTEKMIVQGQKIEAGEPLFRIIDHSVVWVYGEIYEYEMPYIKLGQSAKLYPAYSTTEAYRGKIEHIYSHLGSIRYIPESGTEVRTAKVRFELPNPKHQLKLGMYLNVEISTEAARGAVAVPDSAVIDTGDRQVVIIDRRDGTFEPRDIKVGGRGEDYYQVTEGVKPGEWVVTSANFLIDSESNLRAALSGMRANGTARPTEGAEGAPEALPPPAHGGH